MSGVIVCAGIPRSGTTMMFRALAGLPPGRQTPSGEFGVQKTHTPDPSSLQHVDKAIFLFGNPIHSVISTRQRRYGQKHFENCGAGDRDPETTDIYHEDALNYERMFDEWTHNSRFDTLCVRYETLYENLEVIQAFFPGRHLYIPPKQARLTDIESSVTGEELEVIKATYAGLIEKIDGAPDISIRRKTAV